MSLKLENPLSQGTFIKFIPNDGIERFGFIRGISLDIEVRNYIVELVGKYHLINDQKYTCCIVPEGMLEVC